MRISRKTLVVMLGDAISAGRRSSFDLRGQAVEEILSNHGVVKLHDPKLYSVMELKQLPLGTKFHHPVFGIGEIVRQDGIRDSFMKFENQMQAFVIDEFPWNMPMLKIE